MAPTSLISGGGFQLPTREHQYRRMAAQGCAKRLGPLDTKIDAAILDAGDGRLRNAAQSGELGLTQTLQLTDDAHRFTGSDIDAIFGRDQLAHVSISDSRAG